MKKWSICIYIVGIHLLLGFVLLNSDFTQRVMNKLGVSTQSNIYHQMLHFHTRMDGNLPNKSVIFIGDSTIQGLAVSAVVTPSVNYGIGGDTTEGVLKRVAKYESIKKARAVVIAVGINDFAYRSNEQIFENIKSIAEQIPMAIPIVISAILPIDEKIIRSWSGYQNRIVMLNSKIKNFTDISDRLFFINIGNALVDSEGNLADIYHVGDGLHLNSRGNDIWISELREVLKII